MMMWLSRIEALVGEADIRRVALGHQHTLLLDAEGAVYSCGDNQQGQCGLGTPLQTLADQQRAEWEVGRAEFVSMSQDSAGSNARASFDGSQSAPWRASQQQQQQRLAWSQFMQPFALQKERQAELEVANRCRPASALQAAPILVSSSHTGQPIADRLHETNRSTASFNFLKIISMQSHCCLTHSR